MLIYAIDDEPAMLAELHDAIAAAVEAGLVQGTFVDGKLLLRPKAQISRLEALALLARFLPEPSVPGEAVAGAPAWAAKELARLEAAGFASALHDLEYAGVASLANIGETASAPVLAGSYAGSLVPVGILMALMGYVVGTPLATLCANIMKMLA